MSLSKELQQDLLLQPQKTHDTEGKSIYVEIAMVKPASNLITLVDEKVRTSQPSRVCSTKSRLLMDEDWQQKIIAFPGSQNLPLIVSAVTP